MRNGGKKAVTVIKQEKTKGRNREIGQTKKNRQWLWTQWREKEYPLH